MRYGSLFSGIEAASLAWRPLGWQCAWVAEIDPFCRALLKHHYPDVPNLGDVTKVDWDAVEPVDLIVGGSPCQSFSIAGKRLGLDDPRGNLALVYLDVVRRVRPRWVLYENVPGLLSSDEGRDFGAFLGLLGELGHGFAYRVLDAQYGGVPQRRRRLWVVGHSGGQWQRAAAVLFDAQSLHGDPAPGRQAGERAASTVRASASPRGHGQSNGIRGDGSDNLIAAPITPGSPGGSGYRNDADTADNLIAFNNTGQGWWNDAEVATGLRDMSAGSGPKEATLVALDPYNSADGPNSEDNFMTLGVGPRMPAVAFGGTTHTLDEHGRAASEDGTGRGAVLVPVSFTGGASDCISAEDLAQPVTGRNGDPGMIAFTSKDHGADAGDTAPTLRAMGHDGSHPNGGGQVAVAFDITGTLATQGGRETDIHTALRSRAPGNSEASATTVAMSISGVRRLLPVECERLMAMPDGYTAVPYRGKPAADGPRYKAIGNSMVVSEVRWIGERIGLVDGI